MFDISLICTHSTEQFEQKENRKKEKNDMIKVCSVLV